MSIIQMLPRIAAVVFCGLGSVPVCVVAAAVSTPREFATIPDQPDDPAVHRLFLEEYPSAAARLLNATRRAKGRATVRRTTDDTTAELFLEFRQFDDHLVVRRSASESKPGPKDEAALITPSEVAIVRAPLTAGATPVMKAREANQRLTTFVNRNWRYLGESAFSVDAMRIQSRLESRDWTYVRGHRDPSNPEFIVVHFAFRSPDFPGAPIPHGTVDVVFDRRADWAVRRFRLHSEPYNFLSQGELETERVESLGVVPKALRLGYYEVDPSPAAQGRPLADLKLMEAIDCTWTSFSPLADFRAADFSLSALGVTYAFGARRWALLVFGNIALFTVIVLVLIRWRRTRRLDSERSMGSR